MNSEVDTRRRTWNVPHAVAAAALLGVFLLLALWATWDFFPGTVRQSASGVRGTGTLSQFYKSGGVQRQDYYVNGILRRSTWYRPDGKLFAKTSFDVRTGGKCYFLRDDGSVRLEFQVKYSPDSRVYVADGPAVRYLPDGSAARTCFRDGQETASP